MKPVVYCHRIGARLNPNFNTLEEILAYDGPIQFDGIYLSVYEHFRALLGKDVSFFVMGQYLGGDNTFDRGQPYSKYCTAEQILEMADYLGARIGYHSWSHKNLKHESSELFLATELSPPVWILNYCLEHGYPLEFAWPYGDYNDTTCRVAQKYYVGAWSCMQGDDTNQFALKRRLLNW